MTLTGLDSFCGGHNFFGPLADDEIKVIDPAWTDVFDFSRCFQAIILACGPPVVLLVLLPFRWYYLNGLHAVHGPSSWMYIAKHALLWTLVCMQLGDVIYRSVDSDHEYEVISAALLLCGYAAAIVLLMLEHGRGHLSSSTLTVFWLLTIMVDVIRLRSSILRNMHGILGAYSLAFMVVQSLLDVVSFVFSAMNEPTYYHLLDEDPNPCPEEKSALISRFTFFWMNPLMAIGYRRTLTQADLWSLHKDDQAPRLHEEFKRQWAKRRPKLVAALSAAFGSTFVFAGVLKLVQDILQFIQPQLLDELIAFISDESVPAWHGYGLAAAMLLAALMQSVFLHQYFHLVMRTGMQLRASIITSVYAKSLSLSTTSRQQTTSGEIVNLMAVDAQRFLDLMTYLHSLWSSPLQIGIALYMLWALMGVATLAGFGVMILMIPLNGWMAKKFRAVQITQMKFKDQRIKQMNEVLSGMKVIKLYAWERPFSKFISDVRNSEMGVLRTAANLSAWTNFSWIIAPFFVTLVTFIVYSLLGNDLDARKAFVSLALFNLLRFPLSMLPFLISSLTEAHVSLKRLSKFLQYDETDPNNVERNDINFDPSAPSVKIENGNFSWDRTQLTTLQDVDLEIPARSLTAVIGPVGAGKSSIVSAILGDMERITGRVVINGSVAYVPQQAWIRNATVRDNILFGMPYDPEYYNEVVAACALTPDLEILPAGDMTEIGEKGINLSGGQKQRISMARAVYQRSDVYILDDPLSAVDSHVCKHLFERVIGPAGLLGRKTRILVTHNVTFLDQANQIVVMARGRVEETGSYTALLNKQGAFARYIAEFSSKAAASEEEHPASSDKGASQNAKEGGGGGGGGGAKDGKAASADAEPKKQSGALMSKEDVTEGGVKGSVFMAYFRAIGLVRTLLVLMFYVVAYGFQVGSNVWLSKWSSESMEDPEGTRHKLPLYLGVYAALGVLNGIFILIVTLVFCWGAVDASWRLHEDMLQQVMRSPLSFFETTPLGRILNRFAKDMYTIDETIPRTVRSFMSTFMGVVAILVVISYSTPIFMTAVLPMGLLYYGAQRYYVATSRQLKRLESASRSPVYAHFGETLTGVASIRAYHLADRYVAENQRKVDDTNQAYFPSVCANRWLALRLEFVGNCIIFFAALFAVIERGKIDPGIVGLSLSYAMSVTQTLNWMVRMSSDLETDIVAVERIEEYCHLPSEAPLVLDHRPPRGWPARGEISFRNYSTRYREGLSLVLRNINCDIHSCEKIGIVGRTGAGKSSLTLSLFRIIEPAGGQILIDGEDVVAMGLEDLRSRITVMPQDPVLFSGTLRQNLDPFNDYTDDNVWRALETCHLKAFIRTLQGGLTTKVNEGGENFSVGQRQLLCLARAVLRKTKVLVLDEATAAVDPDTDKLIQTTIREEFRECTVLTIAHRLNTIMDSDKVLVLDQGQIAEFDSPENLMSNSGTVFASMCRAAGILAVPSSLPQIN